MPTVNRSYRAVERQWLGEYLQIRHPGVQPDFERRLHFESPSAVVRGPSGSPTGQEGRPIARLDAWVSFPSVIEIWEAAQWFHWGKVAQVEHYRDLLPRTWEAHTQIHVPVTWHILTSHHRREIAEACAKANIEYNHYLPEWLRLHQIEVEELGAARRRQFAERSAAVAG
jgi:hypothetical protein